VQQDGVSTCPVSSGQLGAAPSQLATNPYVLQVDVTEQANVFFLAFVLPNLNTATVTRSAQAQYLPPITLGARTSYFGDESTSDAPNPGNKQYLQYFWANINGPQEVKENGDAYNPANEEGWTDPNPSDPQYHPNGS
jgi:hypothetical protein